MEREYDYTIDEKFDAIGRDWKDYMNLKMECKMLKKKIAVAKETLEKYEKSKYGSLALEALTSMECIENEYHYEWGNE